MIQYPMYNCITVTNICKLLQIFRIWCSETAVVTLPVAGSFCMCNFLKENKVTLENIGVFEGEFHPGPGINSWV